MRTIEASVQRFANEMQAKLDANAHKGHWRRCTPGYLKRRMRTELLELFAAMDTVRGASEAERPALQRRLVQEAADVGNFAMMMADNFGDWDNE